MKDQRFRIRSVFFVCLLSLEVDGGSKVVRPRIPRIHADDSTNSL